MSEEQLSLREAVGLDLPDLVGALDSDLRLGLTGATAGSRLKAFGPNDPSPVQAAHWPDLLLRQFANRLILLLLAATVISGAIGEWLNATAIGVTILASVGFGFLNEFRSEHAAAALRKLTARSSEVIRDGLHEVVASVDIVPGDLVVLTDGDVAPADGRLVESRGLVVDESIMTGEPAGIHKAVEASQGAGPVQINAVYAGTTVVAGSGSALVVATGRRTELGKITAAVGASRRGQTPLEIRLEKLSGQLILAFLGLCGVVVAIGLFQGREARLVVEIAVSLAIGAVPEGLPAVATTTLAVAVRRLAARNVIVRRMDAVESLGSTTVVVTDKTGTLTENRMVVRGVLLADGREFAITPGDQGASELELGIEAKGATAVDPASRDAVAGVLIKAALCNDAVVEHDSIEGWHAHGEPTEVALAMASAGLGYTTAALLAEYPRIDTEPFTSARRLMKTTHASDGGTFSAIKGSPEAVAALAGRVEPELMMRAEALSDEGLRVLAVAEEPSGGEVRLLGLVVLEDPLRADAREAVRSCLAMGVRVMLATGDHMNTARRIGQETGVLQPGLRAVDGDAIEASDLGAIGVVARATHAQKQAIVQRLRASGEVVAMMGDGVNDAPALSAADVGVAVGPHASDVAMEASHVVVSDGRLESLVQGIAEGRQIARNLAQAITYLLVASFGTITLITVAMLSTDEVPLAPLQILWLNLVVHVFPALALSTGRESLEAESEPTQDVLSTATWIEIATRAATVALSGVAALLISSSWGETTGHTQAMVFGAVAVGLLGQAFLVGIASAPALVQRLRRRDVWLAVSFSLLLALMAMYAPGLQGALSLKTISVADWGVVILCAAGGWLVAQVGVRVFTGRGVVTKSAVSV